jgi:predicted GNAT superfamily acetyltransferase
MYGARTDALNVGLATDRLVAEWLTAGEAGGLTTPFPDAVDLIQTEEGRVTGVSDVNPDVEHLHLEIPATISELRSRGAQAVSEWQTAVRQAFQSAFAAGYVAVGFSRADPAHPRYLLEHAR